MGVARSTDSTPADERSRRGGRAMHVLVVDGPGSALPEGTARLLRDLGWQVTTARNYRDGVERARAGEIEAAVLRDPPDSLDDSIRRQFDELVQLLESKRVASVMVSDRAIIRGEDPSLMNVVDSQISLAELRGQFTMIERYHRLLKRVESELHNMQRLSERLHHHFREVDDELRLAGRLQRDFLPDLSKPFGNLRAAAVYRPATWVSGDMFDVFRIDDEHTGIYIVDAVGHGMAASLLTMFIKRAVVPTHRHGDEYTVLSPSEVMAALNDALANQSLPNCQFVTACYGVFHHPTRRFRFARGGHPYPLLLAHGGAARELQVSGGLLGLAAGEQFATFETTLQPGDKLLFYTDGVELCFHGSPPGAVDAAAFQRTVSSIAALPLDRMMDQLEKLLGDDPGFMNPRDDLTIMGLEVLAD